MKNWTPIQEATFDGDALSPKTSKLLATLAKQNLTVRIISGFVCIQRVVLPRSRPEVPDETAKVREAHAKQQAEKRKEVLDKKKEAADRLAQEQEAQKQRRLKSDREGTLSPETEKELEVLIAEGRTARTPEEKAAHARKRETFARKISKHP